MTHCVSCPLSALVLRLGLFLREDHCIQGRRYGDVPNDMETLGPGISMADVVATPLLYIKLNLGRPRYISM